MNNNKLIANNIAKNRMKMMNSSNATTNNTTDLENVLFNPIKIQKNANDKEKMENDVKEYHDKIEKYWKEQIGRAHV